MTIRTKVKLERAKVREWKSSMEIAMKYLDRYQNDRKDKWLIEAYKQLAETQGSIDALAPYQHNPSDFPWF